MRVWLEGAKAHSLLLLPVQDDLSWAMTSRKSAAISDWEIEAPVAASSSVLDGASDDN